MENNKPGLSPEMTQKISLIIAAIIVFGIIAILGQIFKGDMEKFKQKQDAKVYPKASKMPPALNQSMEEALTKLDKALAAYDKELKAEMNPGLSKDKIANLARRGSIDLPQEVTAFFSWHNGSRKNDDSLEWFVPLEGSLEQVSKKRKVVEDAKYSGDIKDMGVANITAYQKNWIPLYRNSSYYRLSVDISRKPEEGAYFWAGSNQKGYFFFPSMQNALTALAECFEKKAFMPIDKIDQSGGFFKRNEVISGKKPKQLLVNTKKVKDIMTKYGSWAPAEGFLAH